MTQMLTEKWDSVLNSDRVELIESPYKKRITAQLLENQELFLKEDASSTSALPGSGAVGQNWDPILISMVRRMAPKLIAYDVCGVQPMNGPTGLVFAMRARYNDGNKQEALFNEARAGFSGNGVANPAGDFFAASFEDETGTMATAQAESDNAWDSMTMTIERTSVTAGSRQLRSDCSLELIQDLKAIHGLDAENELAGILSSEITNEINREVVRKIYTIAKIGGKSMDGVTDLYVLPESGIGAGDEVGTGTFSIQRNSDGRWAVEKFKGLFFALEREANQIALETRRGKGNIVITSANVASALVLAGILDYAPATQSLTNLEVDITGVTYAGTVGRFKVYVDPYLSTDGFVMGFKGSNQYDAGFFYCPYVPLQIHRATNPTNFQPAVGFKTRYGLVANPFAANTVHETTGAIVAKTGLGLGRNENEYYRKLKITGL